MTAARDARGRFVTVPDLILDTACREAVRVLAEARQPRPPVFRTHQGYATWTWHTPHRFEIEAALSDAAKILDRATHTAALVGRSS